MMRDLMGNLAGRLLGQGIPRSRDRHCARVGLDASTPPVAVVAKPEPGTCGAVSASDALRKAFTPTRPIRSARRFAGRRLQFARVLRALLQEESHVVIYADRGRGKTSLANLVAETLRGQGVMVARYACSAEDDFDAIMRGLMRDLPRSLLAVPARAGDDRRTGCEAALPAGRLQPRDVLGLTGRLTGLTLVLIVDEFDRINDGPTRTRLADTIKVLSDRAAPMLFLIVGVSDNLEELLGRHPSIQRSVVGVPLPLLSDREITGLLEQGASDAGLVFAPAVREIIAAMARGVPYTAQLLALYAGHAAIVRGAREVSGADLRGAVETAISEADLRVAGLYERLTDGGQNVAMVALLRGLAGGAQDGYGRLIVGPADEGGVVRVAGRPATAALWMRVLDSGAVRRCGDGPVHLFAMTEPTFGSFVLMCAASDAADRVAGKPSHGHAVFRGADTQMGLVGDFAGERAGRWEELLS